MERERIWAQGIDEATEEILNYVRLNRDIQIIYFDGWNGFGAAPVLRSIEQVLSSMKAKKTPSELCYDTVIYIDCSAWESRRAMQRKIAEELKLDHKTMSVFDKHDEEDDFHGVDGSSRDVIRSVSKVIHQTLGYRKFMMIFLNGSDDEVDVNIFGISPKSCDHVIVWTFKRRFLSMHPRDSLEDEIAGKLRYTDCFITNVWPVSQLATTQFSALLREEAAIIVARHPCMRGIDLAMVVDCLLYELFLHYSFHSTTAFDWAAHASNYWMCDGIIKGDITREIINALHQEIHWECDRSELDIVFEVLMKDLDSPFLVINGYIIAYEKRPYRWISISTSKNLKVHEDIPEKASSLFVAFQRSNSPQGLPNGLFEHCGNLAVLTLSSCAFSFVSPPFLHQCPRLRFLGLDQCTNDNTREGEDSMEWTCLHNLWVLDIRYTDWNEILSEEKMDLMANLTELNIEGVRCWQYTSQLQGKLPYLQKLRIIKPKHQAKTSTDCNNTFVDKTKLEILDLSGNKDMKKLPASLSKASSIQVLILDGCDGLENVVAPDMLPSSLRSFSFDGYGPTSRWTSTVELPSKNSRPKHASDSNSRLCIETSKISLQGCTQLQNLFVRGLPNLEELDLSGSAIKVLDLGTMVVDVPRLKRLFLLGCQYLRAIKWGTINQLELDLLCIDTRPGRAPGFTKPSLAHHRSFCLQMHGILTDSRMAMSLYTLLNHYSGRVYFNIHITSSTEHDGFFQPYATGKEMIEPSHQRYQVLARLRYGDVFTKIGDAPMLAFPQPPTQQSDRHVEISDGSCSMEGKLHYGLDVMIRAYANSLHVHDASTSATPVTGWPIRLTWCRVERCPNLDAVFNGDTEHILQLETIWASDLLMARCIWSKGYGGGFLGDEYPPSFRNLQHLHLRSCPRLQFALPVWVRSFPSLKTLHIIHCGDLRHVFVPNGRYPEDIDIHGVQFPKLTTIHLHDLPNLRQISEFKMLAPALETIKIRGCFGLRRLPSLEGREPGAKKPAVEIEKDVWDALKWDGLAGGHHPDLFEAPVHSRYYRRRRLLRGTVLR